MKTALSGADRRAELQRSVDALLFHVGGRSAEAAGIAFAFESFGSWREEQVAPYVVHGLLRAGDLMLVAGAQSAGKTFAALDLALGVASGGRVLDDRPTTAGDVLYLSDEGGDGIPKRIRAWLQKCPDAEAAVRQRFHRPRAGRRQILSLVSDADADKFVADVRGLGLDPRLIVVDNLVGAIDDSDENSNTGLARSLGRAKQIGRQLGAAVIVLHHLNASGSRARGASSIMGRADCAMAVVARRDGTARCTFSPFSTPAGKPPKDAAAPGDMRMRFQQVEVGVDDQHADRPVATSCFVTLEPARDASKDRAAVIGYDGEALSALQDAALRVLASDPETSFSKSEILAAMVEAGSEDPDPDQLKRALADLRARAYVVTDGERRWARYQLTGDAAEWLVPAAEADPV
jgi:hypothetical protein